MAHKNGYHESANVESSTRNGFIEDKIVKPSMIINPNDYDEVEKLASFVRAKTQYKPKIAIICGTGLGKIVNLIEKPDVLSYTDIPGFPVSTVRGHKGNFVFGSLNGKSIVCMQGRIHTYEGYSMELCTLPIRLMSLLGVETLIVTNAAGGLNSSSQRQGDIILIKDHLCLPGFAGRSPLCGPNDERFGPRFPTMLNAYDNGLRKIAKDVAKEIGLKLEEGVYAMTGGPQFETPAENRYFKALGADLIGMSTAHEVIVARHCDIKCLGLSLVTNLSELETNIEEIPSDVHSEVLKQGEESVDKASNFVAQLVKRL